MRKNWAGVPVMFYRRARRPRSSWEIRPCLGSVYLGVKSEVQKQLSQEECHVFSMWLFNKASTVSWLVFLFWCKSQNESLVFVENSRTLSVHSFRPPFLNSFASRIFFSDSLWSFELALVDWHRVNITVAHLWFRLCYHTEQGGLWYQLFGRSKLRTNQYIMLNFLALSELSLISFFRTRYNNCKERKAW